MTTIDTSTEAVERLLENVTPGPWTEHDAGKHPHVFVCGPDELYYNGEVKDKPLVAYVTGVGAIENRAFITAARDLVPALLKERDEARAQLAASQPADLVTNAGCRQQVTVKPLVWVEIQQGRYYEARVIGILYSIRLGSDGVARWQAGHMGIWHEATTIKAAKAAAQADYEGRILAALEPAPVAPSLRITGPNSDGEYWLHIKAGGRFGGVNLGGERGPICKQLLDAASETGAKE